MRVSFSPLTLCLELKDLKIVSCNEDGDIVQLPSVMKSVKRTIKPLYPPSGKSVVVVESVTKAKVIQGYLGDMFEVLPSYGHVRDLAARSGSVRPDDDFSMVWEVPSAAWTHLKSIKVALNDTQNLILASDPDREGEAIAWHIIEMLQQQNALPENINVARVVFNEITESSIKEALQSPRDIDFNLVHAYLARRALDYLIGFNISPLLWRKLPGCQSAGRVQSVALALICDRETEIDQFYWTIEGEFIPSKGSNNFSCPSHLTHYNSKKLNQMLVSSQSEANAIENMAKSSEFKVFGLSKKNYKKTSSPPYITSTLQQDSASKLHFPSSYTMKLAQKLYEGIKLPDGKSAGLITYMRTDGLHMSDGAVEEIRSFVTERYGKNYIPNNARKFFKKVKNAQEAHEAIRPTDIRRLPSMLAGILDEDSLKLYTLIWSRSIACQMEPSVTEQIQVDIGNGKSFLELVALKAIEPLPFPISTCICSILDSEYVALASRLPHCLASMIRVLHSLSGSGHTCDRLFELDFRRVAVSCILNGGRAIAPCLKPRKVYSSIKPISNRSYSAFSFQPLLRSRSPMNTINCALINGGFGLFAPYKSAIPVRYFSQVSKAVLSKNVAGDKEGRKKSTSFLAFNKHWKQSKSLTHKKPLVTNAAKKDTASALKDLLVKDGKKEADVVVPALINNEGQPPKTKAKRKSQPKSRKNQEESTVAFEELTTQTSSKKVSSSKKTKPSKKDVGTPALEGYLGDMFEVLPSYGHVRDLAARSGSVRPDDDFSMVWEVPSAAWTHLKSIKVALNEYDTISSYKS
nr:DNA topoisomerase, type IA, core [Tanacetum cinerariifolium]